MEELPFCDDALSGDTLTAISLNKRWRSLIVAAIEGYYAYVANDETALDNEDILCDFYEKLYDDD